MLIYCRSPGLDLGNSRKFNIALITSKDDQIEKKDEKAKTKQLGNKKWRLKCMKNKDKTHQQTINEAFSSPPTSCSGPSLASFPIAAGLFCKQIIDKAFSSLSASRFGLGLTFSSVAASSSVAAGLSAFGFFIFRPSTFCSSFSSSPFSIETIYLISCSLLGCTFHPVVTPSWAFITFKQEQKRCALFPQKDNFIGENFVNLPKTLSKKWQKEVDDINKKKPQYQSMGITKKEKTVCLMFNYCECTPKV